MLIHLRERPQAELRLARELDVGDAKEDEGVDFDAGVDATLEAVSSLLNRLELPTLKQALSDLGLPNEGDKRVLSERITNALQHA